MNKNKITDFDKKLFKYDTLFSFFPSSYFLSTKGRNIINMYTFYLMNTFYFVFKSPLSFCLCEKDAEPEYIGEHICEHQVLWVTAEACPRNFDSTPATNSCSVTNPFTKYRCVTILLAK